MATNLIADRYRCCIFLVNFITETSMNRRDFLERITISVPASLFLGSFWPNGYCLGAISNSYRLSATGDPGRRAVRPRPLPRHE